MNARGIVRKLQAGSIGHGAVGFIGPQHRYAIVGLVPKKGGGFLKKRYTVGKGRDAHEALTRLIELRADQQGAWGQGRWEYVVLDLSKGSKMHEVVSEDELRRRQSRGE